jgi:hypothetical protein
MRKILGLIVVGVLAFVPAAGATSFTFSTNSAVDEVSATASFNFTGSTLVLTLNNTTPNVLHISQELDGISWNGFTLTGSPIVAAAGVINCNGNSGSACPAPSPMPSSPYHWGLLAGHDKLAAGSGSYHPFAIVDSYTAPGGHGGISNSSHNPLLLGPVTFTFAYSGFPNQVADVTFLWGTSGTPTGGVCTGDGCNPPPPPPPVPEPASLLLLGSGLIGAGSFARRKKR